MAYGGGPSDSLQALMQKKKPGAALSVAPEKNIMPATITTMAQLQNLEAKTKEEKQALIDTEQEYRRRGFFKRIFPCYDFLYYKQFFEEERMLNYIVDSKIFGKKRNLNPQ